MDTYYYENLDYSELCFTFDTDTDIVLLEKKPQNKTPKPNPKYNLKKIKITLPKRKRGEREQRVSEKLTMPVFVSFQICLNNLHKPKWCPLILSSGTRISMSLKQLSFPLR